jgi:filamentous hemagglutinin
MSGNGARSFHQDVSGSTSEGLLLYGASSLGLRGVTQGVELGASAIAAYQRASAGYSLIAASGTGATLGGGFYTGSAALGAHFDVLSGESESFGSAFDQRFSYSGLAVASIVGSGTGAYGTAMFRWAGLPNALTNVKTLPGAIIRVNSTVLGQATGRAGQGAVTPPNENRLRKNHD